MKEIIYWIRAIVVGAIFAAISVSDIGWAKWFFLGMTLTFLAIKIEESTSNSKEGD